MAIVRRWPSSRMAFNFLARPRLRANTFLLHRCPNPTSLGLLYFLLFVCSALPQCLELPIILFLLLYRLHLYSMRSYAPRCLLALLFASSGIAEPIAKPEALPQQLTNNAPFSGAVYIVDGNGGQVSAQGTNYCPSSASLSCSNAGLPSW